MKASAKMPSLDELNIFDSCVTIGRVVGLTECYPDAETLLNMMDRYRIKEALVHEHHARVVYPREHGNRRLMEMIDGHARLVPCWVIEPPDKPGKDPAEALVEEMLEAGVKVARLKMRPKSPLPWLWENLFAVLEEHRVVCFLDFGTDTTRGDLLDSDVNGIRELALAHPGLPLVISFTMGGLGIHPAVLPLIWRTENIFLDNAGILEFWRVIAHEISPQRIIFATAAPFVDPAVLISNIQYEPGLALDAKRAICGGNLRRLLEAVR